MPLRHLAGRTWTDNQLLDRIVQQYPAHIYVYDILERRYIFANKTLLRFHKITQEQLYDDPDLIIKNMHPEDLARLKAQTWREEEDLEFRQRNSDGVWRWFSGRDRVFARDERDEPVAMIGCVVDITDLKMAQSTAEEAKKLVERLLSDKTRFLANMSHEIRTPLTAIHGFSELLKRDCGGPQAQEWLERIHTNSENLLRLVDDILNLSRAEAGKLAVEKSLFSLSDLFHELSLEFAPSARLKSVDVKFDCAPSIHTLYTDRLRLRQILTNLLNNAAKFTDSGHIHVRASYEDRRLKIRVSDTGIGIAEENVEKLFKPYAQADASIERHFGGTGLGLQLSRELARAIGGELTLEKTKLGSGSTFVVDLPFGALSAVKETSASWQDETLIHSLEAKQILLADDCPDNECLIRLMLERAGAVVTSVDCGKKVLDLAKSQTFDVFVLDIRMPDMNGFQVLRGLRKMNVHAPAIAATAQVEDGDQKRYWEAGFAGLVRKPLRNRELISTVSAALHH